MISLGAVSTSQQIAIAVGGVIVGAVGTGLIQVLMGLWELRIGARVAARLVLGNAYVTEKIFELLQEYKSWSGYDFSPSIQTWAEHRKDFAAAVSMADWADVDAFYDNLARTAAMDRPAGMPATNSDLDLAKQMVAYAEAARKVAIEHVPKGFKIWLPSWLPGWICKLISKRQREIAKVMKRLRGQEKSKLEGAIDGDA
jgi:hypothetical protein